MPCEKARSSGPPQPSHVEEIDMDKKIAGLLGAVAALASVDAAHATAPAAPNPADATRVASYAELLAPVPNAVALLIADDAARVKSPTERMQLAQHHHHHHHQYRRRHRHHHHHHHHHSAIPGTET